MSIVEMVTAPAHRGEAHPCPPGDAQGEAKMQAALPRHCPLTTGLLQPPFRSLDTKRDVLYSHFYCLPLFLNSCQVCL